MIFIPLIGLFFVLVPNWVIVLPGGPSFQTVSFHCFQLFSLKGKPSSLMKAPNNLLFGRNLGQNWVILRKNLKKKLLGGGKKFFKGSQMVVVKIARFVKCLSILGCCQMQLSSHQPLSWENLKCHHLINLFIPKMFWSTYTAQHALDTKMNGSPPSLPAKLVVQSVIQT